jgi:hypothetical protein
VIPLGILIVIAIIVVLVKVYGRKSEEDMQKENSELERYSTNHMYSEERYSEKI